MDTTTLHEHAAHDGPRYASVRERARVLADIALDSGFADQGHFSRTLAAITGERPSA